MSLVQYEKSKIEIAVADRVFGDTTIKQKAKFVQLAHTQNDLNYVVLIDVLVTMYANNAGEFGDELVGSGFRPYAISLRADNNTIVNAVTGEILFIRGIETDNEWFDLANNAKEPTMFQGDFFGMLRDTQAITIGDMIKQHINQANAMGKFN